MSMPDRDIRQRELIPPEKLASIRATIVGLGSIGRQVALQLTAIGVPKIQLVDHDCVNVENLATQGFLESDVGKDKVVAVENLCRQINRSVTTTTARQKFRAMQFSGGVLMSCVDSIETRGRIFDAIKNRVDLFVDGRMSAEYLRVITAWDDESKRYYPTTIFPEAEAHRGACTAKSTIYCANIAAGMMVAQFAKWLRGRELDKDIDINLLTNEMGTK